MDHIYLDNAATTCVRKEVSDKMASILRSYYGNPSSTHSFGRSSKSILEKCRKNIASFFNVKPSEIIFTSGGTEADNLVLRSAVLDLKINHINYQIVVPKRISSLAKNNLTISSL